MKILQVCLTYHSHFGGTAEHVRNISERLARKYDVTVFATDPVGKLPKEEVVNGVKVRRFKSWAPGQSYYFSKELKTNLKKNSNNYDVVHAHNYQAFPALYAAQAKNKNRLIFTPHYHGKGSTFIKNLLHIPYKFLGRRVFERADKVICVSDYERSLIMNHFKICNEKATVIPNGVSLEEFKGLEKRKKDCRVILHVGRLEKYKGVQYLIRALPKLDNDIVIEIVGKGRYKKSLVKLARRLSAENRVRFYQDLSREELLQKYVDADLFVSLSKLEAYGMCVAEALIAKTPCIVTNISALKEWINDENCFGIQYPPDIDRLATLIEGVIGKEVNAVKLKSWDEVAEMTIKVYEDI